MSDDYDFRESPELPPRRRRPALMFLAVLVVFGGFAGGLWYAYTEGLRRGSESVAPVISASTTPAKVRPESPGGIEVPYQDTLVYEKISPGPALEQKAQIRSGPEEPIITRRPKPMPGMDAAPHGIPGSPVQIAEPPPEPEITASPAPSAPLVRPAPAAASERQVTVVAAVYRLQLASMRSPSAAAGAWDALIGKHRDILGRLNPVVEKIDLGVDKGIYYRVQAGPLPSEAEAKKLCDVLSQRSVACLVVRR